MSFRQLKTQPPHNNPNTKKRNPIKKPATNAVQLKMPLVSAIRYLEQNALGEDDFIVIDLWGDEGYDLQTLVRQYEGSLSLKSKFDLLADSDNPCKNTQLICLMREIGKADLAIQFIDYYPAHQRDDEELNLRVVIMSRETLQDSLRRFEPCETPREARKASLQRSATAKRPIQRRRETRVLAANKA